MWVQCQIVILGFSYFKATALKSPNPSPKDTRILHRFKAHHCFQHSPNRSPAKGTRTATYPNDTTVALCPQFFKRYQSIYAPCSFDVPAQSDKHNPSFHFFFFFSVLAWPFPPLYQRVVKSLRTEIGRAHV